MVTAIPKYLHIEICGADHVTPGRGAARAL